MSSIIEKLQKLINHEKSAREIGNIAEAEAFASKIQTLLTQHKLTMTEVEFEEHDTFDPISHERVVHTGGSIPLWQKALATGIANNFFCQLLVASGSSALVFIGRASDRTAAVEMYRYLSELGKALRTKEAKAYKDSGRFEQDVAKTYGYCHLSSEAAALSRRWDKSFLLGYSVAIHNRLAATRRDLEASASSSSTGLILRDQSAIDAYVQDAFVLRKGVAPRVSGLHAGAAALGAKHGNGVSLHSRTALGSGA